MEYTTLYTMHYGHRVVVAKYYPRVSWERFIRDARDTQLPTNEDVIAEFNRWIDGNDMVHPAAQQLHQEYVKRYNALDEWTEYLYSDVERCIIYAVERLGMREDRATRMIGKWKTTFVEALNRIAALSAIISTVEY